jgi:hypothetical protein
MKRIVRGLMVVLLVLVALGGCTSSTPAAPDLGSPPGSLGGETEVDVPLNTPYFIDDAPAVCVIDKPVTITGASAIKAAMKVLDWGLQTDADVDSPADGPGTFKSLKVTNYSKGPVATRCDSGSGVSVYLDVEITKPVAVAHGFYLDYRQDGKTRQAFLPLLQTLCTAAKCPASVAYKGLAIKNGELVGTTDDGTPIK